MTLIGKELRERLEGIPGFATAIRLYSLAEDEVGTVTDVAGEAAFVQRLAEGELDDCALVFFCGDLASDRQALRWLPAGARAVILSSGATREDGFPAAAGLNERSWSGQERLLAPSPAALLLARLLTALQPSSLRACAATVILPVSELGQAGLDALFEETRALLTFSGTGKSKLFPSQIAFNLLPGRIPASEVEQQTTALLGEGAPAPTVQALQGGIFHSVAASLLLQGGEEFNAAEARRLLARSASFTLVKQPERLGPIEAAGEDQILVGDLRDAGDGRVWIWAAMDNLTIGGAVNAIRVAEALMGASSVH